MKIDCPICNGEKTAESTTITENIPYFGEVIESSILCTSCGYKYNDIICLEQKDPVRHSLTIKKDKLSSRVIRSQSSTVSIPELGLKVEPGPKSLGYISNVEGVINRFKQSVNQALTIFDNKESQKNGLKIMKKLDKLINGELKATLVIEDPFGQSNIIDRNTKNRPLTDEELKYLKTNFTVFESSNNEIKNNK